MTEQSPQITIRDGSTVQSFDVEIVIPMEIALPDYGENMRSLAPIQPGGRLLLYDQIRFDSAVIRIMLTLLDGAEEGSYLVLGELYGDTIPATLMAELRIDNLPYEAPVRDGKVEFADVRIPPEFDAIHLRLTTRH
jgi:hypothetical protein